MEPNKHKLEGVNSRGIFKYSACISESCGFTMCVSGVQRGGRDHLGQTTGRGSLRTGFRAGWAPFLEATRPQRQAGFPRNFSISAKGHSQCSSSPPPNLTLGGILMSKNRGTRQEAARFPCGFPQAGGTAVLGPHAPQAKPLRPSGSWLP